jgi:hypothetical protein
MCHFIHVVSFAISIGLHGLFIESFVTLVFVGVVIEVNDQVVNCLGISPRFATTRISPFV